MKWIDRHLFRIMAVAMAAMQCFAIVADFFGLYADSDLTIGKMAATGLLSMIFAAAAVKEHALGGLFIPEHMGPPNIKPPASGHERPGKRGSGPEGK